jgi:hypothetical protein
MWVQVRPWDVPGSIAHLRHDLANQLVPLTIAADSTDGPSGPILVQSAQIAQQRLDDLTLLLDPPRLVSVPAGQVSRELTGAALQSTAVVACPLPELVSFCDRHPVTGVESTPDGVVVVFAGDPAWAAAAVTACPAEPYSVRRVGLSLTVLAALSVGGRLDVCAVSGVARLSLHAPAV